MPKNLLIDLLTACGADIETFSKLLLNRKLRPYQTQPARDIVTAIKTRLPVLVRFPRQSGKNEILAITQLYLLWIHQRVGGTMIHVAPTYEPQARNAYKRAVAIAENSAAIDAKPTDGNKITIGNASIEYVSGRRQEKPRVGLTASIALFADEAQDLDPEYMRQAFEPMRADTNAPLIITGTARHTATYLAQKRTAFEGQGGKIHIVNWRAVAQSVPAYQQFVQAQIEELGDQHWIIKNEFENIETDKAGKLFTDETIAVFCGTHQRQTAPSEDEIYTAAIDVGGTSITGKDENDRTIITIASVTKAEIKIIWQTEIQGEDVLNDTPARETLLQTLLRYKIKTVTIDATGLGIGLANWLQSKKLTVQKIAITDQTKTEMLKMILATINTGRLKLYETDDLPRRRLLAQMRAATYTTNGEQIQWGVPQSVRWAIGTQTEPLHDDNLTAAALLTLRPPQLPEITKIPPPPPQTHAQRTRTIIG